MTSEEILQQYMLQQQQANKWNSPQNLINLGILGLSGISGLAGGIAQGRQDDMSAEQIMEQRAREAYARRLQGRQGLMAGVGDQLDRRYGGARDLASLSSLGDEQ